MVTCARIWANFSQEPMGQGMASEAVGGSPKALAPWAPCETLAPAFEHASN